MRIPRVFLFFCTCYANLLNFRYRDLKLATSLIKLGADVNLCPQENRFASEEGVPPLYYATNARDAEMVKLLFNSGTDFTLKVLLT